MSNLSELKEELNHFLDNLCACFDGFDFQTSDGISLDDIKTKEGIEKLIKSGSEVIEFDVFKNLIKKSLYPIEDDLKNTDFDWDSLAYEYEEVKSKIETIDSTIEQLKENLTGDQDVNTVEWHTEAELKDKLLEYFLSENLAYEITIYGEKQYLLNNSIEKKLS